MKNLQTDQHQATPELLSSCRSMRNSTEWSPVARLDPHPTTTIGRIDWIGEARQTLKKKKDLANLNGFDAGVIRHRGHTRRAMRYHPYAQEEEDGTKDSNSSSWSSKSGALRQCLATHSKKCACHHQCLHITKPSVDH